MSYTGNDGIVVKAYRAEGGAIGAGIAVMAGTAANQVKLPTGANVMPIGVTKYAIAEGEFGDVILFGPCDVYVNATTDIAAGDPLTVDGADGNLSKSALTNGLHVCAKALEAATSDGDLISCFFYGNGWLPTA